MAALMADTLRSRPSISRVSNSGGATFNPVVAILMEPRSCPTLIPISSASCTNEGLGLAAFFLATGAGLLEAGAAWAACWARKNGHREGAEVTFISEDRMYLKD